MSNASVLVEAIEHQTHHYLKHRALQTPGIFVHEVNGMPDHIHLAVTIPPTILITDWIGELKGASAHYINHEIANKKILSWQTGYGVVSFGTKDLSWVVDYIRRRKEHHANHQTHERLERIDRPDLTGGGEAR